MARIFMTGLEAGHLGVLTNTNDVSISAAQARTGTYSLAASNSPRAHGVFLNAAGELYGRIGIYPTGYNSEAGFLSLVDVATEQITFCIDSLTGKVKVKRGDHNGTLLATGDIAIVLNAWTCIEYHVVIDNAAGEVEVKVDGVLDIDIDSVDTQESGNASADRVQLFTNADFRRHMSGYLDDIAINDTSGSDNNSWIGRGGIYGLVPSGAGTHTDFTPSAGDNYAAVDEVPPNDDTDYVESDTVGHKDTYALGDLVPVSGDIQAVQWIARAKLDAAGSGNFQRLLRHDGVDYNGSDLAVDVSYKYFTEILEQAPDATDWTIAKVNALEIGMEIS